MDPSIKHLYLLSAIILLAMIASTAYAAPPNPKPLPVKPGQIPPGWHSMHDKDMDMVEDTLEQTSGIVKAYIILSTEPRPIYREMLEKQYGAKITYVFHHVLKGYLAYIDASKIPYLARNLRATDLDRDGYSDLLYIAQPKTYKPLMAWSGRVGRVRPWVWDLGYTGRGVRVAVLDTGIDLSTRGFNNSRVEFHDLVNGQTQPYDEVGHGTMVSYTIAGNTTPNPQYSETTNTILTTYLNIITSVSSTGYYITGPFIVSGDASSLDIYGMVVLYDSAAQGVTGYIDSAYLVHYPGYAAKPDFSGYDSYWALDISYVELSNGYYLANLTLPSPLSNPPKGLYYIFVKFASGFENYIAEVMGVARTPLLNDDGYWLDAGVAPEAGLVVFKVGDSNGIDTSLASQALDTIAGWNSDDDPDNDVNIASMSFGGPSDDTAFHQAIQSAMDYGVLSVVAAGNDGAGANNAGNTFPAAYPEVLTVAATGSIGNITSYSSEGGVSASDGSTIKPDIAAPGGSYYGSMTMKDSEGDGEIVFETGERYEITSGDLQTAQGTSFATPYISGVAALVIQVLKSNGLWDNSKTFVLLVKSILMATAVETYPLLRENDHANSPTLDRGVKDVHEGMGLVDAYAAVRLAESMVDYYMGERPWEGLLYNRTFYAAGGPLYGASSLSDIDISVLFSQAAWPLYYVFSPRNLTYGGDTYVASYVARLVAEGSDEANIDYDLYIYSVSGYNGDPLLDWSSGGGRGVLDEKITFTPEDGVIYYIVAKRASTDVAPANLTLMLGPGITAYYDPYLHRIYVKGYAASSPSDAAYMHVVVEGPGGFEAHNYTATWAAGLGSAAELSVKLPYGISGGNYTVYVLFTGNETLSPSSVVEGPVAANVTLPPPINISYSYSDTVTVNSDLVVAGEVAYTNGTPIPWAEVQLLFSNGTLAAENTTGSDGSFMLRYTVRAKGLYAFHVYVPGSGDYQAGDTGLFNVTVLANTALTIEVSNTTPTTYQVFTVSGWLYDADTGEPAGGETVRLEYSMDNGATWQTYGAAATNSSGYYAISVYLEEAGNYLFRTVFDGDTGAYLAPAKSPTLVVNASPAGSRINMSISPGTVYAGEEAGVNVTLEAYRFGSWVPVDNATVQLYVYTNGSWMLLANISIVNGVGATSLVFKEAGEYTLRAVYPGNESYDSAEALETLTVLARPVEMSVEGPLEANVSETYIYTVTLLDNLTGQPLPGATVEVYVNGSLAVVVSTNESGAAALSLSLDRPGAANITFRYPGNASHSPASQQLSVDARYPVTVAVTVSPSRIIVGEHFNVTVHVETPIGPAAGVMVSLSIYNGSAWSDMGSVATTSSGDALFQITLDEPGNYTFRAEASATWRTWGGGGENASEARYATSIDILSRNVTQYNDGTVYIVYRVILTNNLGEPVAGATIRLYKNTSLLAENTTGSDGVAVLKAWTTNTTALGTYTLEHPGSATTWSSETTDQITALPEPVPEHALVTLIALAITAAAATLLVYKRRK